MTDASVTSSASFGGPAFRPGEAFSESWSLFKRHFKIIAGLAVICNMPTLAAAFVADAIARDEEAGSTLRIAAISGYTIIDLLCACLLLASLTRAGLDAITNKPLNFAEALNTGFDRMLPVAGVLVLTVLAVFGGIVMLVIPGILLLTSLFVTVPVAVIERRTMMECLHRSRALSRGSRAEIFSVIYVLGAVSIAAPPTPGSDTFSASFYLILTIIHLIGFTFTALLQTVIWHRLTIAWEHATTRTN